jgi:hypothetical protein
MQDHQVKRSLLTAGARGVTTDRSFTTTEISAMEPPQTVQHRVIIIVLTVFILFGSAFVMKLGTAPQRKTLSPSNP